MEEPSDGAGIPFGIYAGKITKGERVDWRHPQHTVRTVAASIFIILIVLGLYVLHPVEAQQPTQPLVYYGCTTDKDSYNTYSRSCILYDPNTGKHFIVASAYNAVSITEEK